MNVRLIPRTALNGYLRLVRTPLDTAIGLLPGNGDGPRPAAQLVVDRADATVRSMAGTLLRDPVLLEDGQRRRQAARERERAVRLRTSEDQTAEVADERLEQREEQARKQRQRARETANARRRQAESQAQKEKQQAAKTSSRRREASQKAAAKREEAIQKQAPREELQATQAKSDALRAREAELAARDEARRLADAASKVRAERKADR
jgi:hypothetical protein